MWKQTKQPNLDPVVYMYGKPLNDWLGWCLAVAQTMFGSNRTSPSAWSEWTNVVKLKHEDRGIPSGVYVPIWFDGTWNGARVGHVALYKDGKVWSSPYTHKPYADVLGSIAEVERIYGMRYVGWSEDIGNTRVIEWVRQGATDDEINALYREILERSDGADADGMAHYRGKSYDFIKQDLLQSVERAQLMARKEAEKQAAEERAAIEKAAVEQRAREEEERRQRELEEQKAKEEAEKQKEEDMPITEQQPTEQTVIQNGPSGVVVPATPKISDDAPVEVKDAVVSGSKIVARLASQAAVVYVAVSGCAQLFSQYTGVSIDQIYVGYVTIAGALLLIAYNQAAYKLKKAGLDKKGLFAWFF